MQISGQRHALAILISNKEPLVYIEKQIILKGFGHDDDESMPVPVREKKSESFSP
jgi:hypothetical protein